MLGVLSFDAVGPAHKRRKAMRACQRCKDLKKRCTALTSSRRCHRCDQDHKMCSFEPESQPLRALSPTTPPLLDSALPNDRGAAISQQSFQQSFQEFSPLSPLTELRSVGSAESSTVSAPGSGTRPRPGPGPGPSPGTWVEVNDENTATASLQDSACGASPTENDKEMRYVTMLHLLGSKSPAPKTKNGRRCSTSKLISGTNPLSALLRSDLKDKIVTNCCSFRTPDPAVGAPRQISRRGMGVHNCDWESQYRNLGISEPRMNYLVAVGCFELPPLDHCSHLLETYFSHVHPILPVLDRKDFLARYYGLDDPPPLLVLHAVFLAASRYASGDSSSGSPSEIRSRCDALHTKLRVLIETEICSDRVAVIQATLLASLHWEGREGLNSAIDNLGLAIRACQEMGLHRKGSTTEDGRALLRRLWWSAFALDRLNSAQEGTPFLINEADCDVEMLTSDDFDGEDSLTCHTTMLNLSLACLIQDAVRSLYVVGEDRNTLFTTRGILARQRLTLQLEQLAHRITATLLPGQDVEAVLQQGLTADIRRLWCMILLTHVDAVRILVHRPFITYAEPHSPGSYLSRDSCRMHALDIVSRLSIMQSQNVLRFSWPFTVYAVVNCLLIFWYDLCSPVKSDPSSQPKARQNYTTVVRLLKEMGVTWWAAAAKHKLAEALAKAASELQAREWRPVSAVEGTEGLGVPSGIPEPQNIRYPYQPPPTPHPSAVNANDVDLEQWSDDNLFSGTDNADFWASIGLNFDTDVAENVFSILQPDG